MEFKYPAKEIKYDLIPQTVEQRTPKLVADLIAKENFVVDVHTHFFDMQCINKRYFLIRMIKDFLGLKSLVSGEIHKYDIEDVYESSEMGSEDWNEILFNQLNNKEVELVSIKANTKGIIDIVNARKLLKMQAMSDVYWYYLNSFSLAKSFEEIPDDSVLTTVLMMDLEMGWETSLKKKFHQQISEIKDLALNFPVLPFLACDPRRAILPEANRNLYELFNQAFCEGNPFFGVKIYPAMGYHPSDYRLWPIYEICERYNIPIVCHNGGEAVSTNLRDFEVFAGEEKMRIQGNSRKEVAYQLNNPKNWEIALKLFPKLRLDIAHFGSTATWQSSVPVDLAKDPQQRKETIFELMKNYPNVYSDFAFSIADIVACKNLKNKLVIDELIRSRTLFGSDFWVIAPEGNLHTLQDDFVNLLDEDFMALDLKNILCKVNPIKFLFGN
jgi:predicted TIM-barrel fold metal-dependent hydrolase